ncbi:MAG: TerC family protein [Negativicutes bacterium]|jgi:YjbE family integral membrane protein
MDFTIILTVGSIVLVDLLLSGDNAILIALASRNLPKQQQKRAIFWGTAGAIGLRIVFAFVASQLVQIPLLKAAGGVALLWIAIKLLAGNDEEVPQHKAAESLRLAIRTIIIADGIMSLDNVLAVVALANGHLGLVIFGIAISIPFVMLSSQWLLKMINKFPLIIYVGAAVLGYAAAGMITGDDWLGVYLSNYCRIINISLTAAVVAAGHFLKKKEIKSKNYCE